MTITTELVVFIVTIVAALSGVWWRIDGQIAKAKAEATLKADAAATTAGLARAELADYRTHVAETFVTKQGLTEQMLPLRGAINDMGDRIDKRLDTMTDRLDRVIEANHKPVRRSSP